MSVTFDVTGLPWPMLTELETVDLMVFLNFIDYLGRPGLPAVGAQIFASEGCDACHAVGGGEAHFGPDLADLSAYIRQRMPPGPRESTLLAPGNPNHGAELFSAKGCAQCHGVDGRGGDGGPDLSRRDLHRSAEGIAGTMWNHALAMSERMRARGIGWPELSGQDLRDLLAFLTADRETT